MKLILFDIDGTLLWTDGAGRRAIHRALLLEAGTAGPIETYRFDGKTDPQIVRELLGLAGHPEATDEQRIEAVCRRYVELLSAELGKPTQATRLMVGVAAGVGARARAPRGRAAPAGARLGGGGRRAGGPGGRRGGGGGAGRGGGGGGGGAGRGGAGAGGGGAREEVGRRAQLGDRARV